MLDSSTISLAGTHSGLFSSSEVEALMRIELERARRYRYEASCLLIEVDRLEQLHTMHGYESKLEILGRMVSLVKGVTRAGDLLGYLVDDRLLCVFPHTDGESARGLCDRLLRASRDLSFSIDEATIRITLSVGLAHRDLVEEVGFEAFRRVAASGLAVAVSAGGDRWAEVEDSQPREASIEGPVGRMEGARAGGQASSLGGADGVVEGAVATLIEEMIERAMADGRLSRGEGGSYEDREGAYQREIDLLRRRVQKLSETLGLSEQEVERLRSMEVEDPGLASVYREVQGLSPDDARATLKKALMASIFEANLDLQGRRPSD